MFMRADLITRSARMNIIGWTENYSSRFQPPYSVLARYLDGQQSIENVILTTITALNIVIRMAPSVYA